MTITVTINGIAWQHNDERGAIVRIADTYPFIELDQRKAITVDDETGENRTNYFMRHAEAMVREADWNIFWPVATPPKAPPTCPACGSLQFIKIARYEDGNCRVHCMGCHHEAALTNEEYYVELY